MKISGGIYPTVITPYRADGTVDLDTVQKYIEWYGVNGCHGVLSLCQSTELDFLTDDEILAINRRVYAQAKAMPKPLSMAVSGHVRGTPERQADMLNRVYDTGVEALIWITNRLDPENLGDDEWLKNAEVLLSRLPEDVPLGMYECPTPYKRLVTPRILQWCADTGRFVFMKDTCCDAAEIRSRTKLLEGTGFGLYNANCQTLLDSLRHGAAGYCGIMPNFHPKLYVWLYENFQKQPEKADWLQSFLCTAGFIENGVPYPLTAKYAMTLHGMETLPVSRNRKPEEFTPYAASCVEQLLKLSEYFEEILL